MTAHAVGDDEELLVLDQREVVLVVGPLHPDVGLGGVADLHGPWRRENLVADDTNGVSGQVNRGMSFRAHAREILTIGDELCRGEIVDTNSS